MVPNACDRSGEDGSEPGAHPSPPCRRRQRSARSIWASGNITHGPRKWSGAGEWRRAGGRSVTPRRSGSIRNI